MCFAPQRCALFRHLNFQTWPGHVVFLGIFTWKCASRHNGLHFFDISTPKVLRTWCVLCILTWTCASRHNGVHFFDVSTSKNVGVFLTCLLSNVLRATTTCNFSSLIWPAGSAPPLFSEVSLRPSGAPNHWTKRSESRLSDLFAHLHLLSSDFLPL